MREHLYKGFHPVLNGKEEITLNGKKIKGIWVEGFLFKVSGECSVLTCIGCEPLSANDYSEILGDWYDVIPETVCEFTGLYDNTKWIDLSTEQQAAFLYPADGGKNKKEDWKGIRIFENDIISPRTPSKMYGVGFVQFGNFNCTCCDGVYGYFVDYNDIRQAEEQFVIGNRFSNPELLNN